MAPNMKTQNKKTTQLKVKILALCAVLFTLAASNTFAQLIAYEPYSYTLGTTPGAATGTPSQTAGGGFFGPYNGNGFQTTVAGLSYSGLLTAGNALEIQGGYIGENVSSPVSSGTVYASFLINLPSNPTTIQSGLEMNTGGNGMFVGITAGAGNSQGYLGVNQQAGYSDGAGNLWQSSTPINYGSTYFVVIKLTGNGSSGWTGNIWINPTADTATQSTPNGTFSVPQFTISACSIVNPGGGNMVFDELRMGNSWADVVSYTAPVPLSVSITSPANGLTVGPNYSISANAAVSPNTVSSVTFYDNGNNVGTVSSAPYMVAVTGASVGAHALKAVALDSGSNYATSSIVNITVGALNTVLFQNGDFDHPSGPAAGCGGSGNFWCTNSFGAPFSFSFPTSGGNPNGYAVMDDTGGGSYGVLVGGNVTPIPLANLALVAGQTYNFQQDMIIVSGGNIGGLKIESWGPNGVISDSGNVYPTLIGDGTTWQTYTFPYTIDPAATGLKIVPTWGPNSAVGYDNIGVQVPATALSVAITSPTNNATVNTNFTVTANAIVSPASVTNVYFYVDNVLVGNNPNYPYTYTSGNASLSGSHSLKVVAKASNGNSATSSLVNVTVVGSAQIIPNYPITDAPKPTRQASSVLALYNSSGVYTDQSVSTWATSWSVPSGLGAPYTNTVTGKVILAYPTLQYAGVDFGPLDLSSYTVMHVDVWSPNATQFVIKTDSGDLAPFTKGTTATTFSNKTWVSLDIPLSSFPNQSMSSLGEFLFVDNTPLVENATFYIDNVYFWTTNNVKASIALGKQVSWTSASGYNYQPQRSTNNSTWLSLGSLVTGNTVSNAFDPAPVPFYRVQQISQNIVVNGGFETVGPAGWTSIVSGAASNTQSTNAAHSGTYGMDFNVTGAPAQAGLQEGFIPINGGANYYFSAWSKLIQTGNISFGSFCLVQWFDSGNNFLSQNQVNLTGPIGTWTQGTGSFTAPANATQAQILVIANDGAVNGDFGEVYVDDVALFAGGAPSTNIISATINSAAGVSWKSVPGNTYTVQSTPSLSSPSWSPLGANVVGTSSGTNTVPDPLNNTGNFYRVLEDY